MFFFSAFLDHTSITSQKKGGKTSTFLNIYWKILQTLTSSIYLGFPVILTNISQHFDEK